MPQSGQMIGEDFTKRFAEVVAAGRPYLNPLDFIVATPFGLRFTHKTSRLTRKNVQRLEAFLQWQRTLVGIMEEISPRGNKQSVPIKLQ